MVGNFLPPVSNYFRIAAGLGDMLTPLVTGAIRSLGLELTGQHAEIGWDVIACCRNMQTATDLAAFGRDHRARFRSDFKKIVALTSHAGPIKQSLRRAFVYSIAEAARDRSVVSVPGQHH
jgi:hypothetical protein